MFGYFHRVKGSFVAMMLGIVLVPCSLGLHAWNEYRTVHRSRGLAEAKETVQSIGDPNILATELDQKLVHLSGFADTDEILQDEAFCVSERAIHLARRVYMYQWTEQERRNRENTGTSPDYVYSPAWVNVPVDSSRFHEPAGHVNPSMPFTEVHQTAQTVHVGLYQLDNILTQKVDWWESLVIPESAIVENLTDAQRDKYLVRNDVLFIGHVGAPDPERPEVGDMRITLEMVPPTDVSLLAQLRGNTFGEYRTRNGEAIHDLYVGKLSAADVMHRLEVNNAVLAWVLRLAGLAICVVGFSMILKPLSAVVSFIPFASQLTSGLFFLVAIILASVLSLITIGISWIAVRPVLGVALLAIAAFGIYLVNRLRRRESPMVDATAEIIEAELV